MTLVLFVQAHAAFGCGGGSECDEQICDSVFSPEVIDDPANASFFVGPHAFYSDSIAETYSKNSKQRNLSEWSSFFSGHVGAGPLEKLVYSLSITDLDNLIFAVKGKAEPKTPEIKTLRDEIMTAGPMDRMNQALFYLGFAKRCEPIATGGATDQGWSEPTPEDTARAAAAKAEGKTLLASAAKPLSETKDEFIRRRYAFQILRLHFYLGDYKGAVAFFDSHPDLVAKSDSIKYRSMDVLAGSLFRQKIFGRANFIYSQIFAQAPDMRERSINSFHPQEQADWEQTLAFAKTANEKIALWEMFGLAHDTIAAIEKIRDLDPASKILPLLMAREVNQSESRFFLETDTEKKVLDLTAEIGLFEKVTTDPKTYRPELWRLGLAHLEALAGKTSEASVNIHKLVELKSPSALFATQVRMTEIFNRVRAYSKPEPKKADDFVKDFEWLTNKKEADRASNLLSWSLKYLAVVYAEHRDPIRALMLADQPNSPQYRSTASVNQLIQFRKEQRSSFDRYISTHWGYSDDDLSELKGLTLFYNGDFKAAAEVIPETVQLLADPLLMHINDCHDCDHVAPHEISYTKKSLIKKVVELEAASKGKSEAAAKAALELGHALYNVTYYGNSRQMYQTAHGNFESYNADWPLIRDVTRADAAYKSALALSNDSEFKAKATFMMAKTAQAAFVNARKEVYGGDLQPSDFTPGEFAELQKSFSKTKYYQEVLAECGFFKTFARKK